MADSKIEVLLLLLLVLVKQKYAQQLTAVITPSGYNASLDPEVSFTFQCDAIGADSVQWTVDGLVSSRQDILDRGISESGIITIDESTGSLRRTLSIVRTNINNNTTIICLAFTVLPTGIISGVSSEPALFKVQGLLEGPSNLMLSEADNQHVRRLTWDEPFSLDITDVDPDTECMLQAGQCNCR